jgi:CRP-like cAMP-binding protein
MPPREKIGYQDLANRFLLALPRLLLDHLLPQLDCLDLKAGHVVASAGAPVRHMFFINRGLVSLIKTMKDGRTVAIEPVGMEGLIGLYGLFDFDRAQVDYVVQIPAQVLRINRDDFEINRGKYQALQTAVESYRRLVINQLVQNAACNRLHSLEARLCRWILIAQDNTCSTEFPLTHEFIALLLGVHRPSVSITANGIQKDGLIHYAHGHVTILDRRGLEMRACECYSTIRTQIDELFFSSLPNRRA